MSKKELNKATENYQKILKENGLDNVIMFAVSEDHNKNLSVVKVHGLSNATAMISMLVKIVSMETDIESTELAKTIHDALVEAEEQYEEYEKKRQEAREKDITVNISI